MFSNYFIYLNTLPKEEAIKQVFMILIFFFLLITLYCIFSYLKYKFMKKNNKKSLIKKFQKKC